MSVRTFVISATKNTFPVPLQLKVTVTTVPVPQHREKGCTFYKEKDENDYFCSPIHLVLFNEIPVFLWNTARIVQAGV